jgi:hypothetical protein
VNSFLHFRFPSPDLNAIAPARLIPGEGFKHRWEAIAIWSSSLHWDDIHSLATTWPAIENYLAVGRSIERVVAATADILAGMNARATLAHQDVASQHSMATILLHAKAFGVAITSVAGRTSAFFMCHG